MANLIKRNIKRNSGQSLLELILAMAMFALISIAMVTMITGSFKGLEQGGEHNEAVGFLEEAVEAVRSIRDGAWNELRFSQSAVFINGGEWDFSGESTTDSIGQFSRSISFSGVCRDLSDDIVPCPGIYTDVHTQMITANVEWDIRPGITNTVTKRLFISNWDSIDWIQTNWSGGMNQTIWSDDTRYNTDNGNIDLRNVGQISLGPTPRSIWMPGSGETVTDTTDTDFNAGNHSGTVIIGSGVSASIILDEDLIWSEHSDSQSVTGEEIADISSLSGTDVWAVAKGGEIIHFDGNNWSVDSYTAGEDLKGVSMNSSTGEGWAVGKKGEIAYYDGNSWSNFTSPTGKDLESVSVVSTSEAWAVGKKGLMIYFDGNTWQTVNSSTNQDLKTIDMLSASNGWAMGKNGTIVKYNGVSWNTVSSPTGEEIKDISMVTASDGWAVGKNGVIIHYNGTSWSVDAFVAPDDLEKISMVSSSDGWAVGKTGTLIQYNGASWASIAPPVNNDFKSIHMIASDEGWVGGKNGIILEYGDMYVSSGTFESRAIDSGTTGMVWNSLFWTEVLSAGSDIRVSTRTGNTPIPGGGWSGWSGWSSANDSTTINSPNGRYIQYRVRFDRGTNPSETPQFDDITIIYNATISDDLEDLSIVGVNDIWAVGKNGVVVHYDGNSWTYDIFTAPNDLKSIDMVSASDGWAVGKGGTIIRYDGVSWSNAASPTGQELKGIDMVSASDGWAVGKNGVLIHYNGSSWSIDAFAAPDDLEEVSMVSSSDGWAVGKKGTIVRYNGAQWSNYSSPTNQDLKDVFMVSATDGWAVGKGGRIFRYNGASWSLHTDTGNTNWESITMASSIDGWVIGKKGDIYIYDGNSWQQALSPTGMDLKSIEMVSPFQGWIVGKAGTLLKLMIVSGILSSSAFDMSDLSPVQVIEWDEIIPTCSPACKAEIQLRTAPDNGGVPGAWTSWYGESGAGTYFITSSGTRVPIALNWNQWVQYRVTLTGDGLDTPIVEETRVNYK